MNKNLKAGKVWHSKLSPNRSIRLLREFSKNPGDKYFEFRPGGWVVQGMVDGKDYAGEYEICQTDIEESFSASSIVSNKKVKGILMMLPFISLLVISIGGVIFNMVKEPPHISLNGLIFFLGYLGAMAGIVFLKILFDKGLKLLGVRE